MSLSQEQLHQYHHDGYLTIQQVFSNNRMDKAIKNAHQWQEEFLKKMSGDEKKWYIDGATRMDNQLRKLDNPVSERAYFKELALDPKIITVVEEIIGKDVIAFFSQIFFKPPEGGGSKPVHQDNFYFGCDKGEKIITVWVALDEATTKNGCLYYGKGTNNGKIIKHFAPKSEPFNYQIPKESLVSMTPAPVNKGGVNLHHGRTFHQSSNNTSNDWRRALAIHYIQKDGRLINPIFKFDSDYFVKAY